jgi:glycine/D-amino acid oxidase-like deaminating enzyme
MYRGGLMDNKSTWRQFHKPFEFPKLKGLLEADVVIIGGGLTGIIAAYLLRDSGLSIAVVEAEVVGYRASGSTTAFLMEVVDTDASELTKLYGTQKARQILDSHKDAINFYEQVSQDEGIEWEFTRTSLFAYAQNKKDAKHLQKEVEALNILGRKARWRMDNALAFKNKGYLQLEGQAKMHPLKFLFGLAERAHQSGVRIYEHTRLEISDIRAKKILVATHYPPDPQPKALYFKKAAYMTYVVEAELPPGTLPEGLYEDTRNPYHYLRVDKSERGERLLVGGADHRMDIPVEDEKAYSALKNYLRELLPSVHANVVREWKGMIVEPGDGLAFIGPIDSPNIFYATGYSGNGITYAVIAAHLFRDFVLGTHTDVADIYAANRPFDIAAHAQGVKRYLGEFLGGMLEVFSSSKL